MKGWISVGDFVVKLAQKRAISIIQSLREQGFEAFLAGGCVRDQLLNTLAKDFDIATSATPEAMLHVFKTKKLRTVVTGIEHGTVGVITDAGLIEVTTFRKDIETDGRHAKVDFAASLQEDADRRDFTINAMYMSEEGEIIDLVGGRDDLESRTLRFVGDARKRIKEDYLRIMRLYRFRSRLGFTPDTDAILATQELHAGLQQISHERVSSELLQILAGDYVVEALTAMIADGVLQTILPQLSDKKILAYLSFLPKVPLAPFGSLGRLAVLIMCGLKADANPPDCLILDICKNLRLSKLYERTLLKIAEKYFLQLAAAADDDAKMNLIDKLEMATGKGSFLQLYLPVWETLSNAHRNEHESKILKILAQCEQQLAHLRTANLPITGPDVMTHLNIESGPRVGEALALLKKEFRNQRWKTAGEGIALLKKSFL